MYAKPMLFGAYWAVSIYVYIFFAAFASKRHLGRVPLLISMVVPPVLTLGTLPVLQLISTLTPSTFDFYLYAFDGSYGFQPGFVVGTIVQGSDILRIAAEASYVNLPAAMTIVYCLEQRRDTAAAKRFFVTIVLLAVGGCVGYLCFPAVGSVVAFGERFPDAPPELRQVSSVQVRSVTDPRNCIPSLHTAWALIVWMYSTRLVGRAGKRLFALYVALTLIYTLSCGHYLVDMVVAVPFTAMIHMIACSTSRRPLAPIIVCFGVVAVWLVFLRFAVPIYTSSVLVPWTLTAATFAISITSLRAFGTTQAEITGTLGRYNAISWKRVSP
jgi:hypothetical protein